MKTLSEAQISSKKLAAGLTGIFLGVFGVHKFVLGQPRIAVMRLVVSLAGGALSCGLAPLLIGMIGLVEGIGYLTKTNEDFRASCLDAPLIRSRRSSVNPKFSDATNLFFALLSSLAVIYFSALWAFLDIWMRQVALVAWILFALVLIGAFRRLWGNKGFMRPIAWAPVLIQSFTLVISIFIPLQEIMIRHDFDSGLKERERVVGMILAGTVKSEHDQERTGSVVLPGEFRRLSVGSVYYRQEHKSKLLFFTRQASMFSRWGYLYTPNGVPPAYVLWNGDIRFSQKLAPGWFRVVIKK